MLAVGKANLEKTIVLILLAVFGLFVVKAVIQLRPRGAATTSQPTPDATATLSKTQPASEVLEALVQQAPPHPPGTPVAGSGTGAAFEVQYTAETVRDPLISLLPKQSSQPVTPAKPVERNMSSPMAAPRQPPPVVVQGMLWGGPRPQALIDDKLYTVGDLVGGARILAIARGGVTVEVQGTTFLLKPTITAQKPSGPRRMPINSRHLVREPQETIGQPPRLWRGEQ